jgi:hypothetical protein
VKILIRHKNILTNPNIKSKLIIQRKKKSGNSQKFQLEKILKILCDLHGARPTNPNPNYITALNSKINMSMNLSAIVIQTSSTLSLYALKTHYLEREKILRKALEVT